MLCSFNGKTPYRTTISKFIKRARPDNQVSLQVKQVFKHGKERLNLDNLRWRGAAKVRMHVALCYSAILAAAITAHKMGRPELTHSIKAFQ